MASPADPVVVAEAVAEARGSGRHGPRSVEAARRVATIAHVARGAKITPVKIDVLSNCAPVLRADPYSLDNDALAESIEASRAAGFDPAGLWGFHVMFGGNDAAQVVTDSGMPVQIIDAALGWAAGASNEAAAEIDGLIALADQLGANDPTRPRGRSRRRSGGLRPDRVAGRGGRQGARSRVPAVDRHPDPGCR